MSRCSGDRGESKSLLPSFHVRQNLSGETLLDSKLQQRNLVHCRKFLYRSHSCALELSDRADSNLRTFSRCR